MYAIMIYPFDELFVYGIIGMRIHFCKKKEELKFVYPTSNIDSHKSCKMLNHGRIFKIESSIES